MPIRPILLSQPGYTAEDLFRMRGDEPWELSEGRIRRVPGAGGLASSVAGAVGALMRLYVRPRSLGLVTAANGGFITARSPDTVLLPDVGFAPWSRMPGGIAPETFCPFAPELAVEVLTFWNVTGDVEEKMVYYRMAGVPLVWWVYPRRRAVAVYRDGVLVAELGEGDALDGEEIVPGFVLPVAEIFA